MRVSGVRGLLVYYADYRCSHSIAVNADRWPDKTRLSDSEKQFTCSVCGRKGAEVRPDFDWDKEPVRQIRGGYFSARRIRPEAHLRAAY